MMDEIDNILDLFNHCTSMDDCSECCFCKDGSCVIRNPLDWEASLGAFYAKDEDD